MCEWDLNAQFSEDFLNWWDYSAGAALIILLSGIRKTWNGLSIIINGGDLLFKQTCVIK